MKFSLSRKFLPFLTTMLILLTTSNQLTAQFEHKISLNLSTGIFNTIGSIEYDGEYQQEPTLMPNFKTGFSFGGGLQVNINVHFSLEATIGLFASTGWYYDASDGGAPYNYLYYEEYVDPENDNYDILFSGENEMTLSNLVFGFTPKYYFLPGKKLNPFAFAGITYTITHVDFIDNATADYLSNGLLNGPEEGDVNYWFTDHSGLGLSLGAGIVYRISDLFGVFAQAGYYFTPLKEDAFINNLKYADFHALNISLGVRLSFMKTKDL